mgnify:CR=1 FL=1
MLPLTSIMYASLISVSDNIDIFSKLLAKKYKDTKPTIEKKEQEKENTTAQEKIPSQTQSPSEEETKTIVKKQILSPETEQEYIVQLATTMNDRELMSIFRENKDSLKDFSEERSRTQGDWVWTSYDDFIRTWKELTIWYSKKSLDEKRIWKKNFLAVYVTLEKERLAFEKWEQVSISQVNGNAVVYAKYENKKVAQLQILIFSFLRENDGDEEDYQNAQELLEKVLKYMEDDTLSSEEKDQLKQEIQQAYSSLAEPKF